ncbi:hypothetical protein NEMBOFW57_006537 [Staphylotrichum longicolle]|uniref:lytic cellulose monooxygenase (C4-dehydrogenating) n=1 Tax=Staphylotrichum longicolle TaxID=669026 RepID=A0AAD4ET01_9PEZI|nr:hypothetical protein NEMBOFW57_006537 [Staphylotrichum longicolle]
MKSSTIFHLAGVAQAHTIMQSFNGNPQGAGIYMPSDDSFISDVTSNSIACNGPPVTSFRSSSQVFTVQAGSQVTGAWLHTLTNFGLNHDTLGTGPDSTADNKVIDSSHKGPVSVWMKKVSDATQNPSAGPGGGWFKIAEEGLNNGRWGVDTVIDAYPECLTEHYLQIASGGIQKATIPACIENGDYLLRFEMLALHSAYSQRGAQFYWFIWKRLFGIKRQRKRLFGIKRRRKRREQRWGGTQLIDTGVDLTQKGVGGRTPLFTAAYFGWRKVAEMLIVAQVDVNTKGDDDWT